jgi:hypothetical protein
VENAEVTTLPELCVVVGLEPVALTDSNGDFRLSRVPEGPNTIFAKKEEAGYPDARFAVYTGDESKFPRIVVQPSVITSGVRVTLGKKTGTFLGNVVDAETSIPIVAARVVITRVDNPQLMYSTSVGLKGDFRLLLPSRPSRLQVTAPGYKTWTPPDSRFTKAGVIQLGPEESIEMGVRLGKRER